MPLVPGTAYVRRYEADPRDSSTVRSPLSDDLRERLGKKFKERDDATGARAHNGG